MKKIIAIEGMTCGHCKARVEKALNALSGVASAVVDLANKTATVELEDSLTDAQLIEAIDDAGYDVTGVVSQ